MEVDVVNMEGQKVSTVELPPAIFEALIDVDLMQQAHVRQLTNARLGTHDTKTRSEVSGGGRKPWKQKGTGRARMGSVRSTLWRHGATTHGPQPRDYGYRLNKKMVTGALRSALSAKLRDGELVVVDGFNLADQKTKSMASVVETLGAKRTVLLVSTNEANRNLELGSRNLPGVKLVATRDVTTYDLLAHKQIVLSQAAAEKLSEALAK